MSLKALVLGAGISGKGANKLLKKLGYSTYLFDDKKKFQLRIIDKLLGGLSIVAISPGVRLDHPIVRQAQAKNIEVVGELELGFRYLSCPSIAITGTNGKTTTTTLIGELLEEDKKVFVGGNIGVSVCSFALNTKPGDIAVLEVSSFQLESTKMFKPKIAVLLNLSVDHLNRHKTFENYVNAKLKIFACQDEGDIAILNLDDPVVSSLDKSTIKAKVYYFSLKVACRGCYVQGGNIYFCDSEPVFLMSASEVPLKGEHNLSNALAALCAAILGGANISNLREKVHNFKGGSHRLEYIAEIDGVTYINDSKSTNISSCVVAMRAMDEPTTLILGGSDKGFEFDELFKELTPQIKNIVAIGQTKNKILSSAKKFNVSNVYDAQTLKEAVLLSKSLASGGETILLSPACASFDMFTSYEERGKAFTKIVREIEKSESRLVPIKKRKKVSP